jgi:hypothetical protein
MTSADYLETSASLHCITSQKPVNFNTLKKYENRYPTLGVERSSSIGMPLRNAGRISGDKPKRNKNKD